MTATRKGELKPLRAASREVVRAAVIAAIPARNSRRARRAGIRVSSNFAVRDERRCHKSITTENGRGRAQEAADEWQATLRFEWMKVRKLADGILARKTKRPGLDLSPERLLISPPPSAAQEQL
jgi:hypothetical protein